MTCFFCMVIGSPPFTGALMKETAIWKGKRPPGLGDRKRSPWLLITCKSWDDPLSSEYTPSLEGTNFVCSEKVQLHL